jgi:hypothetical protein
VLDVVVEVREGKDDDGGGVDYGAGGDGASGEDTAA